MSLTNVRAFSGRDDCSAVHHHRAIYARSPDRDPAHANTPEAALWTSVLLTWVKDIAVFREVLSRPCRDTYPGRDIYQQAQRDMASLRTQLNSTWTRHMCNMADIEYSAFKRAMLRIASGEITREQLTKLGVFSETRQDCAVVQTA